MSFDEDEIIGNSFGGTDDDDVADDDLDMGEEKLPTGEEEDYDPESRFT